ncbi:hypothetical protein LOD99_13492 [Oopsacas minuta]|uniref:SAM domain-containing protein n=1 Tax=Oopsacas minuta TaxID=111878 RepID=A0AAV7KK63_9METZ|nr:hypothetical protein LOD99_13492 [Oopsacas minuta]
MSSSSSSSHSTIKEWKRFLIDAGLPKELALHYAEIFSHHRMRMSMLPDLNKDILFFMGIEVMGDVIAILKHAKQVSVSLGYSKDYESSKPRSSSSNRPHKRERTPQYHESSRQYNSSSNERKHDYKKQDFNPSPPSRRSNKSGQEFSSFQHFSRNDKRSPEINVTFTNTGIEKYYRGSEATDSRSLGRYDSQTQNQAYTSTLYRNRDIRCRSRSPVYSTRLHMDESPAKHNVRSRISSRPDHRSKQKLSPITFSTPMRSSHASNTNYSVYRSSTRDDSYSNDNNDHSYRETGRMYADIEERQQQQQQQKLHSSNVSYVNEQMPSLTIHVDNRSRNKREIHKPGSPRWPRTDTWQHDDRKSRYERNQSPVQSIYNRHSSPPKSYGTRGRHDSVFNRLT